MDRVGELPDSETPFVHNGPCWPRSWILISSWWLTREIESAHAKAVDVTLRHDRQEVSWHLPATKTDVKALGAARAHRCSCGELFGAPRLTPRSECPACTLWQQAQWAQRKLCPEAEIWNSSPPLFPTGLGEHVTKSAAICTITKAARLLGLPTQKATGSPSWGGHSLRRGGAQFLASAGVDIWRIQALAMHSTAVFLKYV